MIFAILFFALLQAPQKYEHFDVTWNINIAQRILANPDSLKVSWQDTTIWYFKHLYSNYDSFLNKEIKYINDNFSDINNIIVSEMMIVPRMDEQRNLSGYNCHISFLNKVNGKTIDFLFIEIEKGKWRIYGIYTESDKDPFR